MLTKKKYRTVIKPWGKYEIIEKRPGYWLKKLYINQKASLSLQSHQYRTENWIVLKGNIQVIIGEKSYRLTAGDYLKVTPNEIHRITGLTNACVLEIAFGRVREKDVIRLADEYGRR